MPSILVRPRKSDMPLANVAIYVLLDAEGQRRYVGKSNHPSLRFNAHRRERTWPIRYEVLEWVSEDEWKVRERFWIKQYRTDGHQLENKREGGSGWSVGYKHREESKLKCRLSKLGTKHTPETIEKLRQCNLGRKMSAAAVAKSSAAKRGSKHSMSSREKMSQAHLGRSNPGAADRMRKVGLANRGRALTPATREKMSHSRKGREKSTEHKSKIGDATKSRWQRRAKALAQLVALSVMLRASQALANKTKEHRRC